MSEKKEKKVPGAEPIPPELVEQAKAGDQAAFTELYERTSAMLYRTIHSMVRDEDLVWDIQQDSYLRAWRSLDKLESNEAFLSWLRRIAVNTATDALSKRVPLTFTELAGEEDEDEPELPDLSVDSQPELALDRKETSRLVRELLAELSPEQQAVVGMYYYEDMPVKDIAALLQVSPSTVKNQLARGRKKVEAGVRALEKQGVKLYGLSPLPFLLALLRKLEPSAQAERKALAAVLAEAPAGTAAAGTAGASTVTALTAGQFFLKGLGAKLLAGVLALSLIAVGGKLAYDALADRKLPPIGIERPTAEETRAPSELITPSTLHAPDDAPENACGPNLTWRFDEATGTLTIEGSGEMDDFRTDLGTNSPPPWISVCDLITSVALPNELSSIGDYAFFQCSKLTSLVIPERVTTTGDFTFVGCTSLTSVTIPESVTTIGNQVFDNCTSLTSVTIPESVTTIGNYAFLGCSSLTSVTISESVSTIGDGAFDNCTGLNAFSVHPENASFAADETGALYNKDYTTLIACPCGKSGAFSIPNRVTTIGNNAFYGCAGLTSVTIPESVTTIGYNAFLNCSGLLSVAIPESVTSIGNYAFYGCTGLTSVTIPEGVTTIEAYALYGCSSLTSVMIPEGVSSIGHFAFANCDSLTSVTIPKSVVSIRESTFEGCTGLKAFSVHSENANYAVDEAGVLYNKDYTTLIACPRGKSGAITIPESVVSIGEYAFYECTGLTSVTIPDSVTSIRDDAFCHCTGLTTVIIPQSVTSINEQVFGDCSALTSVTISEGVTSISVDMFQNCTGLRSVTIPESVTTIGDGAFSGCTGLTSVTIPESVISIEESAFANCENLTIRGAAGSEAERYAEKRGIPFEAIP